MKLSIILLRIIHGLFALYFIFCLIYMYFSAITKHFDSLTLLALISLATEGLLVFILNKGDCILIHVQKRIGDPVPFFNLIFPEKLAKKAIPAFAIITILGLFLLIFRFVIN